MPQEPAPAPEPEPEPTVDDSASGDGSGDNSGSGNVEDSSNDDNSGSGTISEVVIEVETFEPVEEETTPSVPEPEPIFETIALTGDFIISFQFNNRDPDTVIS